MIKKIYRAILFDFDGTIFDSWPAVYQALVEGFMHFHPNKDYSHISLLRSDHINNEKVFRKVFQSDFVEKEKINFVEDIYSRIVIEKTPLFAGINKIIKYIESNKMLWGIVTTKRKKFVEKLISHYPLFKNCSVIICFEDVEKLKPDPEGLLKACKIMNISAQDAIYVGDSRSDILAAAACPMDSVCATYGYVESEEKAKLWAANYYVSDIKMLSNIIK